ncbi:MAG: hypothetical protein IPM53_00665 [Anaerolineaceae bacterium]|nr:hypothetical protein [Anaerolineaceae bacterium]
MPTAVPTLALSPTAPMPAGPQVISPENARQLTQQAQFCNGRIDSPIWSPDGKIFAVGSSQTNWWDLESGELLHSLTQDADFSTDGRFLAAVNTNGVVRLWTMSTNTL